LNKDASSSPKASLATSKTGNDHQFMFKTILMIKSCFFPTIVKFLSARLSSFVLKLTNLS
jgi:hypothetical protein